MVSAILTTAFWLGSAAALVSGIELVMAWFFAPAVFNSGMPVLSESHNVARPSKSHAVSGTTRNAAYRLVDENRCWFRRRYWHSDHGFLSPMVIRGEIVWVDGDSRVKGGTSLFVYVFFLCFVAGVTISTFRTPGYSGLRIGLEVTGWLLAVAAFAFFTLAWERRVARSLIGELDSEFEKQPPNKR